MKINDKWGFAFLLRAIILGLCVIIITYVWKRNPFSEAPELAEASETILEDPTIVKEYYCMDCSEDINETNYYKHLEQNHRVVILFQNVKNIRVGDLKIKIDEGTYRIKNTGTTDVFVRIKKENISPENVNQDYWEVSGDYIYYKRILGTNNDTEPIFIGTYGEEIGLAAEAVSSLLYQTKDYKDAFDL